MAAKEEEEEEEEEEEDQIMQLFDLYWFKSQILTNQSASKQQVYLQRASSLHDHVRSFSTYHSFLSSKNLSSVNGAHSPNSVLAMLMLESIQGEEKQRDDDHHQVNRIRASSKSIAELEFEEIKGFMDLGFEFSEEDKSCPGLVSILPGLKRLGRRRKGIDGEEAEASESVVSRPYLSEAWGDEENSLLMLMMKNWKVLSLSNEGDMKRLLKIWARSVASAVRWQGTR